MSNDYYGWFSSLHFILSRAVVLSSVEPHLRDAFRVLHHHRNRRIKKQAFRGYVLTGSDTKLSGLTEPLKRVFYPYQKAASTGGGATGGSRRGNDTDRELAGLILHGRRPELGHSSFSVYTERVLEYLHKHSLQPFAAQHLIFDENLKIATELDILAVDLKVTDGTRNVVCIQLKTGFDKNYETYCGKLCSPYVPNSPLKHITKNHKNTHQLQVLCEHMIFQLNYDRLLRESVALVVSEELISLYRISKEIYDVKKDVYANLYQRLSEEDTELDIKAVLAAAAAKKAKNLFTKHHGK